MFSADKFHPARRALLAAGTKTYIHGADFIEPLPTLDGIPAALQSVVETLTTLGYAAETMEEQGYLLNPNVQRLKDAVRAAAVSAPVVVVYYTGHGIKPERNPYYLLTTESRPGLLSDTALEARQLLDLVLRRDAHGNVMPHVEQPHVLIILDCCFSGTGGIEALKESLQAIGNPNVWVLASATSVDYAQQGRFAAALRQVLMNPETGHSQPMLGLDWVSEKIKATLGQKAPYFPPGGESVGLPPFFPNRDYRPNLAGLTVAEQHWITRLRGVPEETTVTGFYITGRTGRIRAVEDLGKWMREPRRGGLAVVTGSPGCGKSAILALPTLLTRAQSRQDLLAGAGKGSLIARAADQFVGLPVLAVHARGMNTDQVAQAIAVLLGRGSGSAAELLEDLDENGEKAPRIVIVDALDEARFPGVLVRGLLLPLARRPELRVVIGTRRHAIPSPEESSLMIDLDADSYRDAQALTDYVREILIAAREQEVPTPYRNGMSNLIDTIAAAIAEKATARPTATGRAESFLLAQLLARAVRSRERAIDVTQADWANQQLPADVGAAFDEDLGRLGDREPVAKALLAALAWARGTGLPWETIWVPVAQELASLSGNSALSVGDNDVRWLLEKAGAYVVEDVGPGNRSVFRPFHDLLASHLRGGPQIPSGEDSDDATSVADWRRQRAQIEHRITSALLSTVPTDANGQDWRSSHPYIKTYLAQHAAAAGPEELSGLVENLDFLAIADPVTLTPLVPQADPKFRRISRIYRRARPLFGDMPTANAAYLEEAAWALGNTSYHTDRISPLYHTRLTAVRQDESFLTFTGHSQPVASTAFGSGRDGRLILASGSWDRTVRLWDPRTAAELRTLTPQIGTVTSVAFETLPDGRLLLAAGSNFGLIRFWEPFTGEPLAETLSIRATIWSLALGRLPDGRLLLAAGCNDKSARLWDPLRSTRARKRFQGHTDHVKSVAFGTLHDGRLLLATGSDDKTVRLWDPLRGTPVGAPLACSGPIWSLAFGRQQDGRLLLAAGGKDGTVDLWDPIEGNRIGNKYITDSEYSAWVAFGNKGDGSPVLAISDNETVTLLDPLTRSPAYAPLTSHTDSVVSVALQSDTDDRLLLAAGSWDGTIRLWDVGSDQIASHTHGGQIDPVRSVAFGTAPDGRILLASGSDFSVRLWDPVEGKLIGEFLRDSDPELSSPVAFGTERDGRLLLATGSLYATCRIWDPVTGAFVGEPDTGFILATALGALADGRLFLATGEDDGIARLWEVATGNRGGKLLRGHAPGRNGAIHAVAFGHFPDGNLILATGSEDRTIRLWDPITAVQVGKPLVGHGQPVSALAFGTFPSGEPILASGSSDASVRLWDPITGSLSIRPLRGHADRVNSLAFATLPTGRLILATGGADHTIRLWDPVDGSCIATLRRRTIVQSVAACGAMLAIGDNEGISVIELSA